MSFRIHSIAIAVIIALPVVVLGVEELTEQQNRFFEAKIRPVLVKHCYSCHSAEAKEIKGGLRLDTRKLARAGGESGPAVVPGDLSESLLIDAIMSPDHAPPD